MAAAACVRLALMLLATPASREAPVLESRQQACLGCGSVRGFVKTAGDRAPVTDAAVLVWPAEAGVKTGRVRAPSPPAREPAWLLSTRSDETGAFAFDEVPRGKVRIAVVAAGHERAEHVIDVGVQPRIVRIFARPDEAASYRTVVRTRAEPRAQATTRVLTREEIATLPGSQGDPLRALQNLPGVARVPGGLGLLILRGAAPGQSRVFMGGHAMPRAFHFLSLASVFPADILDELEFVPGNFDAAHGNASGGIVRVEPRRGRRDGLHGYSEIDLAGAGTMLEGPLGRGSFIVGGQRGYVDLVLKAASSTVRAVTGETSPYLFPSYWDYHALFDHPVGRRSEISLRLFGAGDRMYGEQGGDPSIGEDDVGFDFRSQFHRMDLAFRTRGHGWTLRLTPSFRFELGRQRNHGIEQDRRRRDYVTSVRAEIARRFSRRFSLLVGADTEVDPFDVRVEDAIGVVSGPPDSDPEVTEIDELATSTGLYATGDLRLGRVTVRPGVRASAFTLGSRHAFAVDPRFVLHADPSDDWRISMGLGRYSQASFSARTSEVDLVSEGASAEGGRLRLPPIIGRLDPAVSFETRETAQLPVMQALQASLGARVRFGSGFSAGLTGFLRDQHDGDPVAYYGRTIPYETRTRVLGLEAIARKRMTRKLYGWIAYTLMHAQVRSLESPPGIGPDRHPSDFDQRHNLVLVLSYALPRRWRIGGRFRLASGYPFSPVIGTSVTSAGGVNPVFGHPNSARLPLFHQLDLRVDRRWILRRAVVTAYVDVQNLYNRPNPEAAVYSVDYRERIGFVGTPIFPSFGLRVDY